MINWQKVDSLMQQEVSRKEFLRYVGIALLGFIGIASMVQNLEKALSSHDKTKKSPALGYGNSVYGR